MKEIGRAKLPPSIKWRLSYARLAFQDEKNFGDQLAPLLVQGLMGVSIAKSTFALADLLSVGSILEQLEGSKNAIRPLVWGSGFIQSGKRWGGPDMRPVAVRGMLTRERVEHLTSRQIALGDPGLLVSRLFPEAGMGEAVGGVSVVPHYVDQGEQQLSELRAAKPDIRVVDVRAPVASVVQAIAGSSLVLSSSLHGLIVADAFNVPNAWVPMSKNVIGGSYKFEDYYSAHDLVAKPMRLREAIRRAEDLIGDWSPRARLGMLQKGLLEAFPVH